MKDSRRIIALSCLRSTMRHHWRSHQQGGSCNSPPIIGTTVARSARPQAQTETQSKSNSLRRYWQHKYLLSADNSHSNCPRPSYSSVQATIWTLGDRRACKPAVSMAGYQISASMMARPLSMDPNPVTTKDHSWTSIPAHAWTLETKRCSSLGNCLKRSTKSSVGLKALVNYLISQGHNHSLSKAHLVPKRSWCEPTQHSQTAKR